jgi:hypothetical protein
VRYFAPLLAVAWLLADAAILVSILIALVMP